MEQYGATRGVKESLFEELGASLFDVGGCECVGVSADITLWKLRKVLALHYSAEMGRMELGGFRDANKTSKIN